MVSVSASARPFGAVDHLGPLTDRHSVPNDTVNDGKCPDGKWVKS